jgi:glutaredoxin
MYFIIGKDGCIYCDKAKALLDKDNTAYVYKNLSMLPVVKRKLWEELLKNEYNMKTLPAVVKLVGGYKDLEELLND